MRCPCHPLCSSLSCRFRYSDFEPYFLPITNHTPLITNLSTAAEQGEDAGSDEAAVSDDAAAWL